MAISASLVKELRDKTGAGMMDCKKALEEVGGDLEKAVDVLRKKGLKDAGKRSGKIAAEGIVYSYLHPGSRIGVLVELNSETDFVARGTDFEALAKRIAMHVAWAKPLYVSREEVPGDVIKREEEVCLGQLKPGQEKMADKIISGRMDKFFEEVCLLNQKDEQSGKKIEELLTDLSGKVGEKIALRRFSRFEVGEGIEKPAVNYAEEVAQVAGALIA